VSKITKIVLFLTELFKNKKGAFFKIRCISCSDSDTLWRLINCRIIIIINIIIIIMW